MVSIWGISRNRISAGNLLKKVYCRTEPLRRIIRHEGQWQVPHAADATPAETAGRDFSWKDFVSKKARPGPELEQKDACSL